MLKWMKGAIVELMIDQRVMEGSHSPELESTETPVQLLV
jgi:hypothetical protein